MTQQLTDELAAAAARLAQLEAEYEVALTEPGTLQEDRDTLRQLVEEARQAVTGAETALERVEAGTYGRCERCDAPIGADRLEALPHATTCIDCSR
jgi:RNA polymerase-binding transcription factor DksA